MFQLAAINTCFPTFNDAQTIMFFVDKAATFMFL